MMTHIRWVSDEQRASLYRLQLQGTIIPNMNLEAIGYSQRGCVCAEQQRHQGVRLRSNTEGVRILTQTV